MIRTGKHVTILQYQYSVVMSGIERRLRDEGFKVDVLEDFEQIVKYIDTTDVFLVFLPPEIMENEKEQDKLTLACSRLGEHDSRLIIMGDSDYHRRLRLLVPLINNYMWLDKPIDIEVLMAEIEKAVSAAEKKRILIVDDDPAYAGMVREWIKDIYHTDIVTAGMQAIKFLLKKPVDLILLDYEMPVVDGPQVLQMLRQEEETMEIPVVFLTGVGTKEGVERVVELHPEGYMLKNTTREKLLEYLEKKLGQ